MPWLAASLCMTAGLFVLLKAYLVATIMVLVYAGAILVLFLFVVMLIDFKKISLDWQGLRFTPFIAVFLAILFFLQTFSVIRSIKTTGAAPIIGSPEAIGKLLFVDYLLPFELTSFLLLAAVVSVVVLAKKGVLK